VAWCKTGLFSECRNDEWRKNMEYKTLIHTTYCFSDEIHIFQQQFDDKVNKELQKGWKIKGGVTLAKAVVGSDKDGNKVESICFAVGMVKK